MKVCMSSVDMKSVHMKKNNNKIIIKINAKTFYFIMTIIFFSFEYLINNIHTCYLNHT